MGQPSVTTAPAPSLAEKVAVLRRAETYGLPPGEVAARMTHMSSVFFAGDRVYKLKKPVRFSYLDFSTLARRAQACRMEASINRASAPGVYLGVEPLVLRDGALALGGAGEAVDWLVVMRRLDPSTMLEARIAAGGPEAAETTRLVAAIADFYRRAARVSVRPDGHLKHWREQLAFNRRILMTPRLGMPAGQVRFVDAALQRVVRARPGLILGRVTAGRILDCHGDLRPEHVCLEARVLLIDRLEFSRALRAIDPLQELAYLDLECRALGRPDIGRRIARGVVRRLGEPADPALYLFYRAHQAMLRARLSIAHLLDPEPRTPEKWPWKARAYLALARRDAVRLTVLLNRREDRSSPRR
ncbi:MAG: hypothetical protein PHG43_11245 [Phenylobacterium sp.]|nr:hypothetical protein [Phenylobacterium sp.]